MIHTGDCVEVMATMEPASVDAIITDPPYGLEFMGKEWDRLGDDPVSVSWDTRGRRENMPKRDAASPNGRHSVTYKQINPRCRNCGRAVQGRDTAKGFKVCSCDAPDWYQPPTFALRQQGWHERWAREALRIAKPGAYLLAFGGTRTYHRMTCAIEDAGWIIRDCLVWAYAQGFPKSLNVSRDERFCQCDPSPEHDVRPVLDADVPQAEGDGGRVWPVLFEALPKSGLPAAAVQSAEGQLWAEERLVEGRGDAQTLEGQLWRGEARPGAGLGAADGEVGRVHSGAPAGHGSVGGPSTRPDGSRKPRRPRSIAQRTVEPGPVAVERGPQAGRGWPRCDRCGKSQVPRGLGTALKPAWEPIVLARKPLTGSVADNLERYGTGALNIDGCRLPGLDPIDYTVRRMNPGASVNATGEWKQDVEYTGRTTAGRFPSDLILTDPIFDGDTPGVVGGGETTSGARLNGGETRDDTTDWRFTGGSGLGDSGTYSRFFLIPKADRAEREPVLGGHGLVPKRWNDGRQQQDKDYPSLRGASDRANSHPTVKPLDLMRHLVRLVTPTGGTVLDPFLGSGTTALAAEMEGFAWIGIEKEPEYVAIAEARLNGTQRGLGLPA